MIKEITDANFNEETDKGLVLTDFWATWCPPCKMQAPILEELDNEMGDKVKIVEMDVDKNPSTPASFGIMSIPTLVIKKDGEVVEKLVGLHRKEQLQEVFNKYL